MAQSLRSFQGRTGRKNAVNNNVEIKFILSDLFSNLEDNEFDIIVSNPPYIETEEIKELADDVKREPIIALDGGADGLDFYRKISKGAYRYLKDNGIICFEIGYNQAKLVSEILVENKYKNITRYKDYGGNDRVIIAHK